jgi:hypothetical protein
MSKKARSEFTEFPRSARIGGTMFALGVLAWTGGLVAHLATLSFLYRFLGSL